ncbi:NUDIX domain-containing protein [Schleiferiaceae bacterium]|nr:NUDIX domain-containing protein [Schleiferiaceae bacterium]
MKSFCNKQESRKAPLTSKKILAAFPSVEALAGAEEDHLLALWTGLGYYNRARNLQKGAKQIVVDFDGQLPNSFIELLTIKGIGPYTAAAIASICFKEKIGVVDGNVYRVLSRYFGIETPINSSSGQKEFQALANECIAGTKHPDLYNQGIMEFGALHCTPKKPHCMTCPIADSCHAHNSGTVLELPIKLKKGKRSKETIHFGVVERENLVALKKRGTDGIWAGLYEFPQLTDAPEQGQLMAEPIVHKLSHKDLYCSFWAVSEDEISGDFNFYSKPEAQQLGMPIIIADFVAEKL